MWRALSISSRRGLALRRRNPLPLGAITTTTWRGMVDSGKDNDDGGSMSESYDDLFGVSDSAGAAESFEQQLTSTLRSSSSSSSRGGTDQDQSAQDDDIETTPEDGTGIPIPLWTDSWEISDERYQTKMEFDDLPIWSPEFVSRISKERVQILPGKLQCMCKSWKPQLRVLQKQQHAKHTKTYVVLMHF